MRNVLSPGTWKRLTYALALAAVVFAGLIAPVSTGNAGPLPPQCSWNQVTYYTYYSDPFFENQVCVEIVYPCPGYSRTYNCDPTPYYKKSCGSCPAG